MSINHTLEGIAGCNDRVLLDGKVLTPHRSWKVKNHSPDGFSWGYGGSGPSQLALAIMLELTGKPDGYQDFKFFFIANLPQTAFKREFSLCKCGSWLFGYMSEFDISYCQKCNRNYDEHGEEIQTI